MTPPSTMRRDLISAYIAAGAKILSWVIVGGLVYRTAGAGAFALLALIRGTVGLLNYITFGLGPAVIFYAAQDPTPENVRGDLTTVVGGAVDYERPERHSPEKLLANASVLAILTLAVGVTALLLYSESFSELHEVPADISRKTAAGVAFLMGCGLLLRLTSDTFGAFIQARGRIARDNICVAAAEVAWIALSIAGSGQKDANPLSTVALSFLFSGVFLITLRLLLSPIDLIACFSSSLIDSRVLRRLLSFGLLLTAAQLADFLYAPIDYILINRLLDPVQVAIYAPAVQIDAGLIVLVVGLAAVLLPKTSIAHAAGNVAQIRQYYLRGTLGSAALLLAGSVIIYLASPWIFRLWFGNPMPATQSILPLVLVHTVIGGSSAVGRSILLGMGKVKAFTIAALLAGVANVVLSYSFVRYGGMALEGIILGTIIVVVARCAIWMPWYVSKVLREGERIGIDVEGEGMKLET